jgi:hypothetical protein
MSRDRMKAQLEDAMRKAWPFEDFHHADRDLRRLLAERASGVSIDKETILAAYDKRMYAGHAAYLRKRLAGICAPHALSDRRYLLDAMREPHGASRADNPNDGDARDQS